MKKKMRVLLVEDKPGDADLIREMLPSTGEEEFSVYCVPRIVDAVRHLDRKEADLTLLDLDLPDGADSDAIEMMYRAAPNIPIVVISDLEDEKAGIAAVKDGAQDYLFKGKLHPNNLARVLRYAVERRGAEERIRESERIMRSSLDALSVHIAIIDSAGRIVAVNKAWREFVEINGPVGGEIPGNTEKPAIASTQHGNASIEAEFAAGIRSVRKGEKDYFEQEYCCQSRQKQLWFHGRVTPFPGDGPRWVVVAHEDITERKEAEQERVRFAAQLRHTKKMEAIGTLAGGIAHDFNNILSAVLGFTELCLSDVPKGTRLEKNMREVYIAGNRAKQLIKQMLTFAGKDDEKIKPTHVGTVAKEVLKLIRPIVPASVKISHQINSDTYVMANPIQIHQALVNLCTNAIQAMEMGDLSIRVGEINHIYRADEIGMAMRPGHYVTIEVEDSGPGIPGDQIDRIFEPYFTTKPEGEGSGLGLAMVHSIVKKFNGDIWVKSEVGKGTCFTIWLPVSKTAPQKAPRDSERLPGGNERVLFIDDEVAIVNMNKQALTKLGYTVTVLSSSRKALELIRIHPKDFDLVITDMTMPDMTGAVLAAEIIKINPDLPIILCTGYSKIVAEKKMSEIGVRAVLMKPIPIKQMALTIRKILDD